MWWECSECGDCFERPRPPLVCRECGTAGVTFVPLGRHDPATFDPETSSLRDLWLRRGAERSGMTGWPNE
jgi:hypothetical protein